MGGAQPLRVFLAVVIGVALIGFLYGTGGTPSQEEVVTADAVAGAAQEGILPARSYRELSMTPRGPGSGWAEDLAALRALQPGVLDVVSIEGASKQDDLAARAARRAYDGAPPRIPHAIRQDAAPECLSCHEEGLRFRGLLATPMSHRTYTSCTQCHVVEEAPMPGMGALPPDPRAVENRFVGLVSPEQGPRAWSVAPPQIPHRTWMREQCDSCHGVNGRDAIRSTHPWRESCEQCHTSASEAEARPGAGSVP